MAAKKSHSQVIEDFVNAHGDRYDYSQVEYVNTSTKVKIKCRQHGIFSQTPHKHILGRGCPKCGRVKFSRTLVNTSRSIVVDKFKLVHGSKYDYSNVHYIDSKSKVTIVCPSHGPFSKTPNAHLAGQGCPNCTYEQHYGAYHRMSCSDRKNIKPGYVYYVRLTHGCETFDKVGISINPLRRFKSFTPYTVVNHHIIEFFDMDEAYKYELNHHQTERARRYTPEFEFDGKNECYLPFNWSQYG